MAHSPRVQVTDRDRQAKQCLPTRAVGTRAVRFPEQPPIVKSTSTGLALSQCNHSPVTLFYDFVSPSTCAATPECVRSDRTATWELLYDTTVLKGTSSVLEPKYWHCYELQNYTCKGKLQAALALSKHSMHALTCSQYIHTYIYTYIHMYIYIYLFIYIFMYMYR